MSKKTYRSPEEWSQIIRGYIASGETVASYAAKIGIPENSLYKNLQRHRKAAPGKRAKYAKQMKNKGIKQVLTHPSGGFITISNGEVLNGHIKIDKEGNIHLSNDNKEGLKTVLQALKEMHV